MKMLRLVITSFLLLCLNISFVQSFGCAGGVQNCGYYEWATWGKCNSTCNGIRARMKPLCCIQADGRQKGFYECIKMCNVTIDDYFKFNSESEKCGGICVTTTPNVHGGVPITNPIRLSVAMGTMTPNVHGGGPITNPIGSSNVMGTITPNVHGGASITKPIGSSNVTGTMTPNVHGGAPITKPIGSSNVTDTTTPNGHGGALITNPIGLSNVTDGNCANNPCAHGTCANTKDGFHCNCYHIYEGKTCTKMKAWAIGTITSAAIAGSALLSVCFWCMWRLITRDDTDDTDERKPKTRLTKVQPMP